MTPKQFINKVRNYIFVHSANAGLFNSWSDEKYLRFLFKRSLGYELNLDNPKTFNEKQQWMKLHDRNPLYTTLVDKYEVKKFISENFGEKYIIPTLGVWNNADEIDFDALPNQFVLKCTHDSGGIVICKDKAALKINAVREKLNKRLKVNYYWSNREWPYKDVEPKIIAEAYLEDNRNDSLNDYKLFVISGKVYCIEVDYNRFVNHQANYYSPGWEFLPFRTSYPSDENHVIEKPERLTEMLELSEKISEKIGTPAFVRVDLYEVHGKIYFGEITFFDDAGFDSFYPAEYDSILGDLMKI